MEFWDEIKPARKGQWNGHMADVRAARYDGLAALSPTRMVAGAGALAGAGVAFLLLLMPVSFVRWPNLVKWMLVFAIYGALMGVWRGRDVRSGKTKRFLNFRLSSHSIFDYIALPLIPVLRTAFWQPKEGGSPDNLFGSLSVTLCLFWIGAAFDYVWEALDNLALGMLAGPKSDAVAEYTLRMWIPREEGPYKADLHSVKCHEGKVTVHGRFDQAAELRRKLLLLDFVDDVQIVNEKVG